MQCSATAVLAIGIFALGAALSAWSFGIIAKSFMYAMLIAGGLGSLTLLFGGMARERILCSSECSRKQIRFRSLLLLTIAQILFIFLSWIFLYTFESQTRITGRLQALEPGHLISLLQAHPWTLGFAPWMLYAVFGVGLSYLSVCFRRSPTLPTVMFKEHIKHPSAFFYYYCQVVVDIVLVMPFVLLMCLTLIWLLEALNISFDWPSIFQYPWRSFFSFTLIILIFRKSQMKFLDWVTSKRQSLGAILSFYALGIAGLLFWMHSVGSYFTFGTEQSDPNLILKSPLAGSFSAETLNIRLALLIWGWWGLWMPSMASLIARLSIGLKVYEACLNALLLPAVLFLWILPRYQLEVFKSLFPKSLSTTMHWLIFSFLLFVILLMFGKVYTTADIHRGAMPDLSLPLRARLLNKWVSSALFTFVCYMMAIFMLGWVPVQIMGTLGTGFMLSVFFIFLFVLFSSRVPSVDEVKCTVPYES